MLYCLSSYHSMENKTQSPVEFQNQMSHCLRVYRFILASWYIFLICLKKPESVMESEAEEFINFHAGGWYFSVPQNKVSWISVVERSFCTRSVWEDYLLIKVVLYLDTFMIMCRLQSYPFQLCWIELSVWASTDFASDTFVTGTAGCSRSIFQSILFHS